MHRIALVLEVIANAWSQRAAPTPAYRAGHRPLPPFENDFADETQPGTFYADPEIAPLEAGSAERHLGTSSSLPG